MPILICPVCKKEFRISEAQFKLMIGSIPTCNYKCSLAALDNPYIQGLYLRSPRVEE